MGPVNVMVCITACKHFLGKIFLAIFGGQEGQEKATVLEQNFIVLPKVGTKVGGFFSNS
jgi:hypothetical protein